MMNIGIDLKAIVLKASKAGVDLTMSFEGCNEVALRARRGNFTINVRILPWEMSCDFWRQGEQFERMVDNLIYRLDEAEQKMIETGGAD